MKLLIILTALCITLPVQAGEKELLDLLRVEIDKCVTAYRDCNYANKYITPLTKFFNRDEPVDCLAEFNQCCDKGAEKHGLIKLERKQQWQERL